MSSQQAQIIPQAATSPHHEALGEQGAVYTVELERPAMGKGLHHFLSSSFVSTLVTPVQPHLLTLVTSASHKKDPRLREAQQPGQGQS